MEAGKEELQEICVVHNPILKYLIDVKMNVLRVEWRWWLKHI